MGATVRRDRGGSPWLLVISLSLPMVLLVYSVAFFLGIMDLRPNSRLYPQIMIVAVTLLLVSQIVSTLRAWRHSEDDRPMALVWKKWHRTAYITGWTILFVVAIGMIGFYEAMVPYVVGTLLIIGIRKPVPVLIYAAASTLVMYGLFSVVLGVRLPSGFLGL